MLNITFNLTKVIHNIGVGHKDLNQNYDFSLKRRAGGNNNYENIIINQNQNYDSSLNRRAGGGGKGLGFGWLSSERLCQLPICLQPYKYVYYHLPSEF